MKIFIAILIISFVFCGKVPKSQKICLKEKLGLKKAKRMVASYYYYLISGETKTFSEYVSINYPGNIQVVRECINKNPEIVEINKNKKFTKKEKIQRKAKKILRNSNLKSAIITQLKASDEKDAKETCMSLVSEKICEIVVYNLTKEIENKNKSNN